MRKSLALALAASLFSADSLAQKPPEQACMVETVRSSVDAYLKLQDRILAAGREMSGILYGPGTDEQKLSMLMGLQQKYGSCAALNATNLKPREYPGARSPRMNGSYEKRAEALVREARLYQNYKDEQIADNARRKMPQVKTGLMADTLMRLPRSEWLDLTFEGDKVTGSFLPSVTADDPSGSIYIDRAYRFGRPEGNISHGGRRYVLRTEYGDLIWSFNKASLEKYIAAEDNVRSRRMNEFNGTSNFSEFIKLSGILGEKFDGKIKVSVSRDRVDTGDRVFGVFIYTMNAESKTRRVYMNGFDPIADSWYHIDEAVMNRFGEMFSRNAGFGGKSRILIHNKLVTPKSISDVEDLASGIIGEMAVIIEAK